MYQYFVQLSEFAHVLDILLLQYYGFQLKWNITILQPMQI